MRTTKFLAAAVVLAAAGRVGATTNEYLDEAVQAIRDGELDWALELAEEVPAGSEDHARALYVIGEIRLLQKDRAAAEQAFRAAVEERPRSAPLKVALARVLVQEERWKEAESELSKALRLDERCAAAHRVLGELQLSRGELVEAEESIDRALELDPRTPDGYRASVEVRLRLGKTAQAAARAAEFTSRAPEHPLGPFLQGMVLERQGEDEAAIAAYQAALALDEQFLDAHKNLAILGHTLSNTYQDKERNKLALEHYRRYFELGGDDPELLETFRQLEAFLPKLAD
jgi:tetratricopeptide (TPR) repeat protein